MIELKPHYSLLFIDSRDTEVILAKYTGSFKLPSNITFTRLKNHLVISIDIKCHSSESDELKATLFENRFNIQSFIGYKIIMTIGILFTNMVVIRVISFM